MINNFQTLDIKHYIVLHASAAKKRVLDGDCVPMHLQPAALAEVSELGFDFDPGHWGRRTKAAGRIYEAVRRVHAGYLKNSVGSQRDATLGRLYRKLFDSLVYFRRSFHHSDDNWSNYVGLAVAFEMLVTDSYAPNVNERIVRRVRLLLRGTRGINIMVEAVDNLYKARGGIVHTGNTKTAVDLSLARQAFVHAFVVLAGRIATHPPSSQSPMQALCGDTIA